MRRLLFSIFILWSVKLYTQERGTQPVVDYKINPTGKTYAVVVAISDYSIYRKLEYAHRDGMAFADWLLSPGGEVADRADLKLLINEQATQAAVVQAFDWLNDKCKEGDRAFIYFAGHGDVESKSANEPGYLLCYDSPERLFAGGGAISLNSLQELITTLSLKNTKVVVILDACHAGKLAGDVVNGRQRAVENMIYYIPDPNVIKILSCKAEQNSREEPNLGGGRGIFSYYLVNGLKGLADLNKNNKITIAELERYLEDNVIKATAPIKQEPILRSSGSKMDVFSKVNPETRDSMISGNPESPSKFSMINPRVINDNYLYGIDTSTRPDYQKFNEQLTKKRFFIPSDNCAEYYFNKIISKNAPEELKNEMIRNYAVALQEQAQRIINDFISVKVDEISKSGKKILDEYKDLPIYLERASALLGDEHYYFGYLKSNQYLFESLVMMATKGGIESESDSEKQLNLLKKSLVFNQKNPLSLYFLSSLFATQFNQKDSCEIYFRKLQDVNSTWVLPYAKHAYDLARYFEDYDEALHTILKGWAIDSTNTYLINGLASVYFYRGDYSKAIEKYKRSLSIDSSDAIAWASLATCYQVNGEGELAEQTFEKSIKLDPDQTTSYNNYGWYSYLKKDFQQAEKLFLKGILNNPKNAKLRGRLCRVYLDQKKFGKVEEQIKVLEELNKDDWRVPFYRACIEALKGKNNQALKLLKESFEKNFDDYDSIEKTDYFVGLKKDGSLKKLLDEYFEE